MKKASSSPIKTHMEKSKFPERAVSRIEKKYPHKLASNLDEKSNVQPRPPKR